MLHARVETDSAGTPTTLRCAYFPLRAVAQLLAWCWCTVQIGHFNGLVSLLSDDVLGHFFMKFGRGTACLLSTFGNDGQWALAVFFIANGSARRD